VIDPESHLWWHALPRINASLNGASAALLVGALVMIKGRRVKAHATLMISAFLTSTVFLGCYLLFHTLKARHHEVITTYPPGAWKPWYLSLLISHSILAVVILPLIFASFWFAWRRRWSAHKRISSFTFALWLYVSVTGVVVYWMLYHLAPTLR
jgi:uncharacterized membrane protein YozB (DUF420 family)